MKVLLTAINAKYIHSNLAVKYLKQYTRDLEFECEIKEYSINDRIERITEDIIREKPNVVAFSCYIWNIEYVTRISNLIKIIDNKIEIMYGGPEVSYDSEEYLKDRAVDYVVEGEGEKPFREFIEWKLGRRNIEDIRSLYYREQNKENNKHVRANDLLEMNEIIFPYEGEEISENRIVYYEASRGCPFNCKYCLSSTIHGVRFHDIDRVKKELQFLMNCNVRLVKFVDRTFNCNPNFTREIWKFLIESDTKTTFHFEISADLLKPDEIELLKSAPVGRIQFEIGVQSTNPQVLKNINRYVDFDDIKVKVKQLKELKNIKQHLDLIAGLPGEDFTSFKKSFNDVYSTEPEEIQLGFLKLLKGSPMRFEGEKWGIAFSPYPPYEVLKTNDISYEELVVLKQVEEMVDKYYNSGKFNTILKYYNDKFETPFEFYYSLSRFFARKGYFERNISNVDYYKVFVEFNEEVLKVDNFTIREIIKFDYLRFNKRKWLPEFLDRETNKQLEADFKKMLKEKQFDPNRIHLEKFKMDIMSFVDSNELIDKEMYYVFKEGSSKVTKLQELIDIK